MALAHCLGMCGGIVAAYSSGKISKEMSVFLQGICHLFYNFGRITSYVCIGIVCGLIGYRLSVTPMMSAWLLIILGSLLILFAFCYVFFPRALDFLEPKIHHIPLYRRFFSYLLRSKGMLSFYLLGILNGLLPCGMVYYFAGIALSSQSVLGGGLSMGVFGLATFIPLFVFGFVFGMGRKLFYQRLFLLVGFVGMLALGGFNLYKGVSKLYALHQAQIDANKNCDCGIKMQACDHCNTGKQEEQMSCH